MNNLEKAEHLVRNHSANKELMDVPYDLVQSIIDDISDRKGIGDEWGQIDESIKDEIIEEWGKILGKPATEKDAEEFIKLVKAE